ncbi:MAG: DnaJ domain-containing protein [Mariprofundaceae bacterium]|nr:DnaJ domain-containing protein [Mariprofundaceae bacterium]
MSSKKITNYYALLEVRPDASNMDIINAYRQAKLTYKTDSIAAYSLFDNVELDRIRTEIEQAYQTLSSLEKRQAYDAELASLN